MLSKLASYGGLQLKKEETWISTVLFEYGKSFYILGAPVSSALKRASKVSVEGNAGISTLSSEITVFSNGVAVAGSDHTPVCGYFCSLVAGAFILRERDSSLDAVSIAAILLVTRHLGRFPTVGRRLGLGLEEGKGALQGTAHRGAWDFCNPRI